MGYSDIHPVEKKRKQYNNYESKRKYKIYN